MDTPREPGTGPLGTPYPASFASGHLEREKLVKLEGQPRWGGVEGGDPELGLSQGKGRGDGWAKPCSGLTFLVRKSNSRQCQALCVRLPEASGPSFVSSHCIQETAEGVSLEGSELVFPDLVQLICAYCHTRDILLLPLQLPRAIRQAATHKELEAISHLGMEFWSSSLNTKAQPGPSEGPPLPRLKPRPPQELDQGTGAALCFFNPLFPGDLGRTKREKFKRSFKVRVSTETSSPLSPPAVPPPPVPVLPGTVPNQTERHTAVGQLVQDLLTQVRASPEPRELQAVREALSRARAMLSAELSPEKLLPPDRLEQVLEKSLHRSVLKPLRPILVARLRHRLSANSSLGRLAEGLRLARARGASAFGSHLSLPSPVEMEQVRQKLLQLLRAYSPSAQVKRLLQACKLLYTALRTQAGEGAGADEFLPLLSLVLAHCDLPELLLEAEYMSELLEPALLTGEGGYYLTSLSASLALLSGLTEAHTLPLSPSQELQRSLSLWEQRRLPATHCFQHLLRVAYQDPSSGCTSKTLAVPPEASIATLNKLCATKFRVTHPDTFGLFLYKGQDYQRLPPGALAHRLPTAGYLVYRRAEQPETPGASPGAATGEGSGGPEAGDREEDKEGRGTGETKAKTSPRDGRGESETVAEGAEDQARGGPTQPRGPETEESQAAEE
ncbi:PREDICTED: ras and Rab interactor 1 [Bison bison bison]|uniref:Ras and Rab interactor 1 n=1 Tax=Bison bison bison TaxID=43346 RepID=A0A6P3HC44_BISBB|nr:PREDICTED: ras and Rab interactor 1 [Bison bison bison]